MSSFFSEIVDQVTTPADGGPVLSVILPTDSLETIAQALDRLRQQSIARQIEVIVVTSATSAFQLPYAQVNLSEAMTGYEVRRFDYVG